MKVRNKSKPKIILVDCKMPNANDFLFQLVLFTLCFNQIFGKKLQNCDNLSTDQITICDLTSNYDRREVAPPYPLQLKPDILILDVIEVNEFESTMDLLVEIWLKWTDSRLSFPNITLNEWYQIDESTKSQIWHPVLTFENTLNMEKQKVLGGTLENQFWMKHPNRMHYNEIIKIKVTCDFDFQDFPFDSQECQLIMQDKVQNSSFLVIKPYSVFNGSHQTTFSHEPIEIISPRIPFDMKVKVDEPRLFEYWDETYSSSSLTITMKRQSTKKLLLGSYYAPTAVFAIFSMLSFLITPESVSFASF